MAFFGGPYVLQQPGPHIFRHEWQSSDGRCGCGRKEECSNFHHDSGRHHATEGLRVPPQTVKVWMRYGVRLVSRSKPWFYLSTIYVPPYDYYCFPLTKLGRRQRKSLCVILYRSYWAPWKFPQPTSSRVWFGFWFLSTTLKPRFSLLVPKAPNPRCDGGREEKKKKKKKKKSIIRRRVWSEAFHLNFGATTPD